VARAADGELDVAPANQAQVEQWNSPVNLRWVTEQQRLDRVFDRLDDLGLAHAALQPGERVVDVGCGCGASSLRCAQLVGPSGSVLGVDVARAMLAHARERAQGLPQLAFREADAAVYPFPGDADLVYSRLGVMFFGEPEAAFANLRRALRPGGRLCVVAWQRWDDNSWYQVPLRAASRVMELTPPAPPGAVGPQQLADADRFRAILRAGGFSEIALHPHDLSLQLSTTGLADAADFALLAGPLARALFERASDPALLAQVRAAVSEGLAPYASGQTVALGAAIWVATARA
jgi:SAM-dependent methyltransferase